MNIDKSILAELQAERKQPRQTRLRRADVYEMISEALSQVDSAMYESKKQGRRDIANILKDAFKLLETAEREYSTPADDGWA